MKRRKNPLHHIERPIVQCKKKNWFKTATIYLLLYTYIQQLLHHNDKSKFKTATIWTLFRNSIKLLWEANNKNICTTNKHHYYVDIANKKKKTLDTHNDTIWFFFLIKKIRIDIWYYLGFFFFLGSCTKKDQLLYQCIFMLKKITKDKV